MKLPTTPPSVEALLRRLSTGGAASKILHAQIDPAPHGRYYHWDKLRRLQPPAGLSPEGWWLTVKLARRPLLKPLPLADEDGRAFLYGFPDIAIQLVHRIDRYASGSIAMAEPVTNPATRSYYLVSSLIEEAITSSQLEGASTTRKVAEEMIRTGRAPRDRSEKMILNNYHAMNFLRERSREPLSRDLIFELHRLVTDDTLDASDAAGRFRRSGEDIHVVDEMDGVVLHRPPPAKTLEARVRALCAFANQDEPFVHPVVRSILIHFWLAYDHPFVDGNGRTARALFYWSMLRQGYWLSEYLSISRILKKAPIRYARSFLYCETDDNDTTYFLLSQMDVIIRAVDELHAYLRRKTSEIQETETLLRRRRTANLNPRQTALLSDALKHPEQAYTFESHAQSHMVSYMTARADLLQLEKLGLLERVKSGKEFRFFPVAKLLDRLRALP